MDVIMRKKGKHRSRVYQKVNTLHFVIQGVRKTSKEKLDRLRLFELSTLQTLAVGNATLHDATLMRDSLNLSEVMANAGVGEDHLGSILAAQDVLRLYVATGMGTLGKGCLGVLTDALQIHDQQRQCISLGEYEKFITKTQRMIQGLRQSIKNQKDVKHDRP
jgi:hypothetical protein